MKKKVISIVSIVVVIFVSVMAGLFVFYNRDLKYKNSITIKVGDSIPTIDSYFDKDNLKRLSNKKITWNDIEMEDNEVYKIGNYTGYIEFRDKKIKLGLKVVDDSKPVIEGVKDITIYVNDDVDLLKDITVKDNSHDDINIAVIGDYDNSKVGEYQLSYVATDKSGNKETKAFKLIVKEKEVTNNDVNTNTDVSLTTNGYTIKRINGVYYINDILIVNKTYSLPSTYNPNGLLSSFTNAFNSMQQDALKEGINLFIVSGFRSYYRQATIYNNYVNKDGVSNADTYSARSGHSEHQSGLAADINSLEQSFINTKEGQWLNNNCYKYGFIIRFPKGKENSTGYMYEPWHIRYVGTTLATTLYNNGNWLTLEEYFGISSSY